MARVHPEIAGLVDWQPLARGGFSTVWQARQQSLDRMVAVKVDHRPLNEDKEQRRFLREAGAAGRLSGHPGIVTVHDAGILADGRPYLVMDLCVGGSLTRWLKPEGRQSESRIRDVGVRIADALNAAHARGVLHRDVKPANILIDAYGNAGLADFGLAAIPEAGVELSVTLEGMTPAYAPKEVFYRKPPSQYGDVYALAATMYALLDGKPPRWPDSGTPNLPELIQLHEQPIERLPDVDPAFMDVLLGAMNDEPSARPSAAEFRDQLAALTFDPSSDRPVVAAVPGASAAGARPVRPRRRKRSMVPLLLAAALVLALVAVGVARFGLSPGAAEPGPRVLPATPSASTSATPSASASTSQSPNEGPEPTAASPTTPPPTGFIDCSEQLGGKSYCVDPALPECWDDPFSYRNIPTVGRMQDCNQFHSYQTYAAGSIPVPINKQTVFEARKEPQKLCTEANLNKVLKSGSALKDWQRLALPPQVQIQSDNLFRCLVSIGGSSKPLKLKVPPS